MERKPDASSNHSNGLLKKQLPPPEIWEEFNTRNLGAGGQAAAAAAAPAAAAAAGAESVAA